MCLSRLGDHRRGKKDASNRCWMFFRSLVVICSPTSGPAVKAQERHTIGGDRPNLAGTSVRLWKRARTGRDESWLTSLFRFATLQRALDPANSWFHDRRPTTKERGVHYLASHPCSTAWSSDCRGAFLCRAYRSASQHKFNVTLQFRIFKNCLDQLPYGWFWLSSARSCAWLWYVHRDVVRRTRRTLVPHDCVHARSQGIWPLLQTR
jgi:hypothetical protein